MNHRAFVIAVMLVAAPAAAEPVLAFDLDHLAVTATDIVLADRIDATHFHVVEPWLGALAVGATIELRDAPARTRGVLFLVRDGSAWRGAAWTHAPAISIAWADGNDLVGLRGGMLEGQLALARLDTRANVRKVVDEYRVARAGIAAATTAAALDPFVHHARHELAGLAVDRLGTLGAVAALNAIVRDPKLPYLHEPAVRALAIAAGPKAAAELAAVLADELARWKAAAPKLAQLAKQSRDGGWWNEIADPAVPALRDRYSLALTTLAALATTGGGKSQPTVKQFCTLWSTLPPIGYDTRSDGVKVASSQLAEACSRALLR